MEFLKDRKVIEEVFINNRFSLLEEINFIMRELKVTNYKEWEKVLQYIDWYTEKTKKQGFEWWDEEKTIGVYYRYLKAFKGLPREEFPQKDMHYLTEELDNMRRCINKEQDEVNQLIMQKVEERYERKEFYWDNMED